MEPVATRQLCVDERRGQVEPPAALIEHPLDQLEDLVLGEDRAGQLVPTSARATNALLGSLTQNAPRMVGKRWLPL